MVVFSWPFLKPKEERVVGRSDGGLVWLFWRRLLLCVLIWWGWRAEDVEREAVGLGFLLSK